MPMPTKKELEARWMAVRREIRDRRPDLLSFGSGRSTVPGSFTIEARHADYPMPIAIVWYSIIGNDTISIDNSFVFEPLRRCGLRTMLQQKLLECNPTISRVISMGGSRAGRAWMVAVGYRKTSDAWVYRRPRTQRRNQRGS